MEWVGEVGGDGVGWRGLSEAKGGEGRGRDM